MVEAATDVDEEVVGADRIYTSSVVMAVKLLKLTVNVKSPAMAAKSGMMAILFVGESCTHTPYLARHCRRKLVGSLPWGIPTVVVYR